MTLLVLQQLLGRLEELVAHVALEHARDEVDLEVTLVHAARLAHKVAEDALKAWRGAEIEREREQRSVSTTERSDKGTQYECSEGERAYVLDLVRDLVLAVSILPR